MSGVNNRSTWLAATVGLAVGIALSLAGPRTAYGGEVSLSVMYVDMTPKDAASDGSRRCVRYLRKAMHDEDEYVTVERTSRRKLYKLAGKPAGPFMDWPAEAFEKTKVAAQEGGRAWFNVVVLVDCRPDAGTLDILIAPPSEELVQIQLRGLSVGKKAARWIADAVVRRGWVGATP